MPLVLAQNAWWQEAEIDQTPIRYQPVAWRSFDVFWPELDTLLDPSQPFVIAIPHPDGGERLFKVREVPNMEAELAQQVPFIRNFRGYDVDEPTTVVCLDISPKGLSAMWRGNGETVMVEPFNDPGRFMVFHRRDVPIQRSFTCDVTDSKTNRPQHKRGFSPTGDQLFTFRVAIAATGEYTQFHGNLGPSDPVTDTLAEINTALNRVNMIYETDAAIRMVLVANNINIIYTDPDTDPYTNNSGGAMLGQNQANLDAVIGPANYDIGHVFSTGGGGVASLGVVCFNGSKARGVTGLANPIGDPFYVDYVAHEMGHQWDATHTFNGTTGACSGNRTSSSAFEPGSASTIMGYAGICGAEDLQSNSDPYFHAGSLDDIISFSRPLACAVTTPTGNDPPNTVDAGMDMTIPAQTPFALTGSASDPNGNSLTYCFEQMDLGAASPPNTDNGNRPIFRSFNPTTSPTRYVPRMADILSQTPTIGESMATTNRDLNFQLTIRDNAAGGGGVNFDTITLTVNNGAGPFQVTSQASPETLMGGSMITVTWDVANTDTAPILCGFVDIDLTDDNGASFAYSIATGLPNNGSAMVMVPNIDAAQARIRVKCADNIFFNLNTADLTLEEQALCPTDFSLWATDTPVGYADPLVNGIVDVADLIFCLFP